MVSRSNRNTGACRAYRGSGPVGRIPVSEPGNPAKERRKTRPYRWGRRATHAYHDAVVRGRQKQLALVARAPGVDIRRKNPLSSAVKGAIDWMRGFR